MSLTLSACEIGKLTSAFQALVSPQDHPTVDCWRINVNRSLKGLLGADSAGFLLPVADGLALFSEEHDPAALARYPEFPPPPTPDGRPIWETMLRAEVLTLSGAYGDGYHAYLNSSYYQDYAGANGAHDTIAAAMAVGSGVSSLQCWHSRPDGPRFGEREIAILRLLLPAFKAGVSAQLRWGNDQRDIINLAEQLRHAVLFLEPSGKNHSRNGRTDAAAQSGCGTGACSTGNEPIG